MNAAMQHSDDEINHNLALKFQISGNEKYNRSNYNGAIKDYKEGELSVSVLQ